MKLYRWLTKVEKTFALPLGSQQQTHYDKSFDYREAQKTLILTLLLTAALVVVVSKRVLMVRAGAGLGIALIVNGLLNIWNQRLIDKAAGLPPGAIRLPNLDVVLDIFMGVIVICGITLFAAVLWRGEL